MFIDMLTDICIDISIDILIDISIDSFIDILIDKEEGGGRKEGVDFFLKSNNLNLRVGTSYKELQKKHKKLKKTTKH